MGIPESMDYQLIRFQNSVVSAFSQVETAVPNQNLIRNQIQTNEL
ncbi:MAG: hypothetical protein RLZZ628_1935 [Bacteroidota bacterium]|jgi:hypothetical protein